MTGAQKHVKLKRAGCALKNLQIAFPFVAMGLLFKTKKSVMIGIVLRVMVVLKNV